MLNFQNILKHPNSRIIISLIFGLGLASVVRPHCMNCIKKITPTLKQISEKIIHSDGKCYKFEVTNKN